MNKKTSTKQKAADAPEAPQGYTGPNRRSTWKQCPEPAADKTAHTPGPWKAGKATKGVSRGCDIWFSDIDSKDLLVADQVRGIGQSECEANARLMAAAPELLAICNKILNYPKPFGAITIDLHTVSELRSVIAKAEGSAQ